MKKLIIWAALLCLLLAACAYAPNPDQLNTNQLTLKPTMVNTTGQTAAGGIPNYSQVWDYKEYCSMLLMYKDKLPKDFVTFDELPMLGEFYMFETLQRYFHEEDIPWYRYYVVTSTGERLEFHVERGTCTLTQIGYVVEHKYVGDLRTIDTTAMPVNTVSIQIGDVYYVYLEGKLEHLVWKNNGWTITLSAVHIPGNTDGPWIIEGSDTAFQELFYAETAETAVKNFKASMDAAAVK